MRPGIENLQTGKMKGGGAHGHDGSCDGHLDELAYVGVGPDGGAVLTAPHSVAELTRLVVPGPGRHRVPVQAGQGRAGEEHGIAGIVPL